MSDAVERERLDVDLLFVGAGAATLASVIRLADLCKQQQLEMPAILVIEKAPELGGHQLSGAMMDPRGIAELIPDFLEQGFPLPLQVHVGLHLGHDLEAGDLEPRHPAAVREPRQLRDLASPTS